MSTNPDLSYCSQSFQTEFGTLQTDAEQYNTDVTLEAQAKADVVKECESLANEYKGNPGELLAVLIVKVLGSRSSNAYQMELKVNADGIQIQGDLTKLSNNIQNIVNTGGSGSTGVIQVAAETDEMQNVLGTTSSSSPSFASDVQGAIGTTSANLMSDNFANMRQDIYWAEDPNSSYNPTENTTNPTSSEPSSYTYHFNPDDTSGSYMTSFGQMQADLKIQGNPYGAQDANKILLDNYNQNVSVTQSLGSAANAEIGLITSKIKMITSATSDFSQDLLTGNRTAVKDQITQ